MGKIKKKPRVIEYSFGFVGTDKAIQSKIDKNGIVHLYVEGNEIEKKEAKSTVSYERIQKNNKILCAIDNPKFSNINEELVKNFNFIYAVDTNTKNINNSKISVGILSKVIEKTFIEGGVSLVTQIFKNYYYENYDDKIEIEKNTWVFACKDILLNTAIYNNPKIALIVDSDLGNLTKITNREIPIVDDFYLPDNIMLVYGSADAGIESIPNYLIRECDRAATKMLVQKNK